MVLVGCQDRTLQPGDGDQITEQTIACEDSPTSHFRWIWCGPNQVEGTALTQICYGRVYFEDMIFSAVKFEGANSKQCFADSGTWQDSGIEGCERGIKRTYDPVSGAATAIEVNECLTSGIVTSVSGELSTQQFRASHP